MKVQGQAVSQQIHLFVDLPKQYMRANKIVITVNKWRC